MHDPRPAASLNSGLLARRGDARPAMRRQSASPAHVSPHVVHDDLGWNDIGDHHLGGHASSMEQSEERSPIITRIDAIAERLTQPARKNAAKAPKIVPKIAEAPSPKPEPRSAGQLVAASIGRKAAFTLRLDPERHLRLRLLSAVSHRSAQQLLIEALDALLARHDHVEDIASQVKAGTKKMK